jgi:hypothetical protein
MRPIHSVIAALAALAMCSHSAQANPYDQCMLKSAPSIKDVTPNGIDVIAEACVKSTEEPLDSEELAKVQVSFLFGEMVPGMGNPGLILQVYNGSAYDISSITVGIVHKRTNTQRLYQHEVWFRYNRGPGVVTSYGPRHKNRFIKSLTSGEYMFPIGPVDVPQADFFKTYDVWAVSARGVPR